MPLQPASKLYKYLSAQGLIRLLSTRTIRFTQPDFLNDPYECHVTLDRAARNSLVEGLYKQFKADGPSETDSYLKERALANEATLVETALEHYRTVRSELGVLSLSETSLDLLMWAHYGDEHRGAVVEFDYTDESILLRATGGDTLSGLFVVNYDDAKIAGVPNRDTLVKSLLTKSKAWAYEKEWRVIRTLNRLRHLKDAIFVADVAPAAIKQIILGARFPDHHLDDVVKQIGGVELKHVEVNRAVAMPHRFGIRVVTARQFGSMQLHRSHHFGKVAQEAMLFVSMDDDDVERQ